MKTIIGLLSVTTLLTVTACSDNKPAETTKEVIIVPAKTQQAPVAEPPAKNTTIVVDKNGVKVGTKKVDVTINPQKKN
jgi:hypothetical protein